MDRQSFTVYDFKDLGDRWSYLYGLVIFLQRSSTQKLVLEKFRTLPYSAIDPQIFQRKEAKETHTQETTPWPTSDEFDENVKENSSFPTVSELNFYESVNLCLFLQKTIQRTSRRILESQKGKNVRVEENCCRREGKTILESRQKWTREKIQGAETGKSSKQEIKEEKTANQWQRKADETCF
jgi:hypothetical protein